MESPAQVVVFPFYSQGSIPINNPGGEQSPALCVSLSQLIPGSFPALGPEIPAGHKGSLCGSAATQEKGAL